MIEFLLQLYLKWQDLDGSLGLWFSRLQYCLLKPVRRSFFPTRKIFSILSAYNCRTLNYFWAFSKLLCLLEQPNSIGCSLWFNFKHWFVIYAWVYLTFLTAQGQQQSIMLFEERVSFRVLLIVQELAGGSLLPVTSSH